MQWLMNSDEINKRIGINIIRLRKERGWSQQDLRVELSKVSGMNSLPSAMTISAYESGYRTANGTTLIALAQVFGVSLDELCGYQVGGLEQSEKQRQKRAEEDSDYEDHDPRLPHMKPWYEIDPMHYADFDNQPVFVAPVDGLTVSRWGIMDYPRKRICCPGMTISVSTEIKIFSAKPDVYDIPLETFRKLNLVSLMKCNNIYVESWSSNKEIRGYITGYYTHSQNHAFLINASNGITLPYTGLDISYAAFEILE